MRQSVLDNFVKFTAPLEGVVPFMYLDSKGLVTTGTGNLIDSSTTSLGSAPQSALSLPWKHIIGPPSNDLHPSVDNVLATDDEIREAWNTVKSRTDLRSVRGGVLTNLRLDEEGIRDLLMHKLQANDNELRTIFPSFDSWPADAQLGVHSMAWAMGAGKFLMPAHDGGFPKFVAAVNAMSPDFDTAARESHMSDGSPERNAADLQLFTNAAQVLAQNADPDVLYWPGDVTTDAVTSGVAKGGFGIGGVFFAALLGFGGWKAYKAYKGI